MVRIRSRPSRRSLNVATSSSALLAKADHQPGLRRNVRRVAARARPAVRASARIVRPTAPSGTERGTVSVLWFSTSGLRVEHGVQRRLVALEVRNQHLDAALGQAGSRFAGWCPRRSTRRRRRGRRDRPT